MTSNIGAETVSNDNRLGFDVHIDESQEMDRAYSDMREKILEDLKKSVRPEFLNRVDLIDVFRGLNKQDTLQVTKIIVDELIVRLVSNGIILSVDSEVIDYINDEGYSKEFGGRNIRRKVQELLENELTNHLLQNKPSKRRKSSLIELHVSLEDRTVVFE